MKINMYKASLVTALFSLVACGTSSEKPKDQYNQAGDKNNSGASKDEHTTDSDASSEKDAVTDEETWCDSNYQQHCSDNYVVWCNAEEGTISKLNCADYPGRLCQESTEGNLADCVALCSSEGVEEQACSATGSTEQEVAILATAKCLPTKSGNLALFTIKRENCSSCADLTCHIADEDKGSHLNVGEVCLKGTFEERCQNSQALYCAEVDESTIVKGVDCGEKHCLVDANDNYAACAEDADENCQVGVISYRCGTGLMDFYSFKYKCIEDKLTGKTYNVSIYSEPCANGLNKTTCECEADDGWR